MVSAGGEQCKPASYRELKLSRAPEEFASAEILKIESMGVRCELSFSFGLTLMRSQDF